MYRKASIADIEEVMKIPELNFTKDEIKDYLKNGSKFLYVYENDSNDILNATFFGTDEIEDDYYDSEIYGMYTRNIKNKDYINSEVIENTKKELFEKGFRNLIVWCDESNDKMRKLLESSGGVESKTRQLDNKIQVAYSYELKEE